MIRDKVLYFLLKVYFEAFSFSFLAKSLVFILFLYTTKRQYKNSVTILVIIVHTSTIYSANSQLVWLITVSPIMVEIGVNTQ